MKCFLHLTFKIDLLNVYSFVVLLFVLFIVKLSCIFHDLHLWSIKIHT